MSTCPDCTGTTQHRRGGGACLEAQVARLREARDAERSEEGERVRHSRDQHQSLVDEVRRMQLDLAHTEALLESILHHPSPRCYFCGRGARQVTKIIMGEAAGICDSCITLCADILVEEGAPVGMRCSWCLAPLADNEAAKGHGDSCAKSPWKAKYDALTLERDAARADATRWAAAHAEACTALDAAKAQAESRGTWAGAVSVLMALGYDVNIKQRPREALGKEEVAGG